MPDPVTEPTPTPTPVPPVVEPQPKDPSPEKSPAPQNTDQPKTFTAEEVQAMVTKARSDEKSKLYSKVEASDAKATAAEAKVTELGGKTDTIQQELDDIRAGKATELDSITRELGELRTTNKKLETTLDTVLDTATEKIVASELKSYRKEKIAAAGLTTLGDLVKGGSEAEIDQSIADALKKEEAIAAKARDEVRQELGNKVPTPMAPGGTLSQETAVTPANRAAMARLPKAEYAAKRAELMAEAKQKANLI